MNWAPRILIYKTAESHWRIWRPIAYGMRSFQIDLGRHAIHFYRKPKEK